VFQAQAESYGVAGFGKFDGLTPDLLGFTLKQFFDSEGSPVPRYSAHDVTIKPRSDAR
jgi:hypothetical protein